MLVWPIETVQSDQHTILQLEQLLIRGERSSGKFHKQTKENFISRELIKLFLNIFLNFNFILISYSGTSFFISIFFIQKPNSILCLCCVEDCDVDTYSNILFNFYIIFDLIFHYFICISIFLFYNFILFYFCTMLTTAMLTLMPIFWFHFPWLHFSFLISFSVTSFSISIFRFNNFTFLFLCCVDNCNVENHGNILF